MKRGVHGTVIFAIGATDDDRLEVLGEDGAARLDRMRAELSFGPQQFEYGRRHVLARELRTAGGALRRLLKRGGESSYGNSLAAFVAAVRTGVPVRPDLADGLRNLEWIEAAMQSAASGTRVSVSPANGAAP
jgi:predicted dehydrogenase